MAQRWTFEEDYTICKFSYQYTYFDVLDTELERLMLQLKERGFDGRSRKAVEKRFRAYQHIFSGDNYCYATKQMENIAFAYKKRMADPNHCTACTGGIRHSSLRQSGDGHRRYKRFR